MADKISEVDSEGVYLGMSLEDFGVRLSTSGSTPGSTSGKTLETGRGATTMPCESLREAIEHLQGELNSGEPLSSEERARLERVLSDVSRILSSEREESESGIELFDPKRGGYAPLEAWLSYDT